MYNIQAFASSAVADMAQVVEHILGKDEVGSSSLPISSKKGLSNSLVLFYF